ncbi:MAG: hypothetical protein MJZ32_10545 [Bacteroidaceae bacterium]|nr:hypothetical protein [Bacteroidaceae bacterium]
MRPTAWHRSPLRHIFHLTSDNTQLNKQNDTHLNKQNNMQSHAHKNHVFRWLSSLYKHPKDSHHHHHNTHINKQNNMHLSKQNDSIGINNNKYNKNLSDGEIKTTPSVFDATKATSK